MTSISYYDHNADAFFTSTVDADMTEARELFLSQLNVKGHILDAGCGSGRDAKAFLERGLAVTAFDASKELVLRATKHVGIEVEHMSFDEIAWTDEFDGIWACASLLHITQANLPGIMTKLGTALRTGGVFYGSFKYGSSDTEKDGRTFTNQTEESLENLIRESPNLTLIKIWQSQDVRHFRSDRWLNFLCGKERNRH